MNLTELTQHRIILAEISEVLTAIKQFNRNKVMYEASLKNSRSEMTRAQKEQIIKTQVKNIKEHTEKYWRLINQLKELYEKSSEILIA